MLSKWRSLSITLFCDVFFLDRSSLNQLIWHLSLTHSQSLVWLKTWQWDAKMRKTLPGDFLLCLCDQMSLCLSLVTSLGGFPGETGGVRRTATRLIMSGDARLSLSAGELWVSCFSSACVWLELNWWGWGSFSIRDEGGNRSDLEHGDILLKAVERFALWPSEPERTNILHFQIIYHTLKDFFTLIDLFYFNRFLSITHLTLNLYVKIETKIRIVAKPASLDSRYLLVDLIKPLFCNKGRCGPSWPEQLPLCRLSQNWISSAHQKMNRSAMFFKSAEFGKNWPRFWPKQTWPFEPEGCLRCSAMQPSASTRSTSWAAVHLKRQIILSSRKSAKFEIK